MTEYEFIKFKRAIFVAVTGQLVALAVAGLIFIGSFQATTGQNCTDIKALKEQMQSKADIQTVIRIKNDIDMRNQMILDELKNIRADQRQIYNKLMER